MTHTPHSLAEEFPESVNTISTLKSLDTHFANLVNEYHAINRQVHRAEALVEPMSNAAESELRKTRALLKDQIWAIIRDAEDQLTS